MTAPDLLKPSTKYRLRIEDYLTLDRAGAFAGQRTELIDGDVIIMNAEFRPHGYMKTQLGLAIQQALVTHPSGLAVLIDTSIGLPPTDAPLPDIVVTSEPRGEGVIPLASIAFVVEVAASTLAKDFQLKAALYARHRIPEYWVADVEGKVMHQLWAPEGEAYAQRREVAFGERIEAVKVAGLVVELPST